MPRNILSEENQRIAFMVGRTVAVAPSPSSPVQVAMWLHPSPDATPFVARPAATGRSTLVEFRRLPDDRLLVKVGDDEHTLLFGVRLDEWDTAAAFPGFDGACDLLGDFVTIVSEIAKERIDGD